MQEQLARALRIVVRAIAMRVGRDVRVKKPRLTIANSNVRFFQLNAPIKDALHFRSGQSRTRFVLRRDVIIMKCCAIRRENFFFGRRCHYACRFGRLTITSKCRHDKQARASDGPILLLFSDSFSLNMHVTRKDRVPWPALVLLSAIPRILGAFWLPNAFGDAYVYIQEIGTLSTKLSTGAFRLTDLFGFWLPLYQFLSAIVNIPFKNCFYSGKL